MGVSARGGRRIGIGMGWMNGDKRGLGCGFGLDVSRGVSPEVRRVRSLVDGWMVLRICRDY